MQFHEEPASDPPIGPAWICENPACGYRALARPPRRTPADRAHDLKERSVNAHRRSMKVRARADRLLDESEPLQNQRRRKP
jgi:hypothetical protein